MVEGCGVVEGGAVNVVVGEVVDFSPVAVVLGVLVALHGPGGWVAWRVVC